MDVTDLLTKCVLLGASDLHLLPGLQPFVRIDGDLMPMKDAPVFHADMTKSLIYSILDESQQALFTKSKQFEVAIGDEEVGHFRVSIYHQLNGVAAVFRVIPKTVPTFDDLNLPSILKSLC